MSLKFILIFLALSFSLANAKKVTGNEASLIIKKVSQQFATASEIKCQGAGFDQPVLIYPPSYTPVTILEQEAFRRARLVFGTINDFLNLNEEASFYENSSVKLFSSMEQPKLNFILDAQDSTTSESIKKNLKVFTDPSNQFIQKIQLQSVYTSPGRTKIVDENGTESSFDRISGPFDDLKQEVEVFEFSGSCEFIHPTL